VEIRSLSVFFPAYNEEANIKNTVIEAKAVLEKIAGEWEIIVIDDGSKDQTGAIVAKLSQQDKRIRLITHKPNQGYGAALRTGFYNSVYDWIACTDADGQFDFGEISNLLKKRDQFQVVIGYRIDRQDPLKRKIFGWGWTVLANLLLGLRVRDVDCAFKLVKKEVIDTIPKLRSTRGGMISPELLALARKKGFKITEVGVHHYPRKEGRQTGASLKVIIKSFIDLGKLWWQIR